MFSFLVVLAEGEKDPSSSLFNNPLFILLPIGILFYFMLMRPMRRQEAERKALLSNLKKNDKVLTSGGIYGTVISVSDKEDEIVVKVDDNVRLKMTKGSIARNISGEEAAKEQKEQKPPKEGGA